MNNDLHTSQPEELNQARAYGDQSGWPTDPVKVNQKMCDVCHLPPPPRPGDGLLVSWGRAREVLTSRERARGAQKDGRLPEQHHRTHNVDDA